MIVVEGCKRAGGRDRSGSERMPVRLRRASGARPEPIRTCGPAAIAVAALALLLAPASARAGTYSVMQCSPEHNVRHEASFSRTSGNYRSRVSCRAGANGIQVNQQGAGTRNGRLGAWGWRAPEGTVLRGVALRAHLASDQGHVPQLVVGSSPGKPAAYFGRVESRWRDEFWTGAAGRWLRALLRCYGGADGTCKQGPKAHLRLRRVRLTLHDWSPPSLALEGSILGAGNRSGNQTLTVRAFDEGAGARRVEVSVNGMALRERRFGCDLAGSWARALRPCPESATAALRLDTAAAPFRNGANLIEACVEDFTTIGVPNRRCRAHTVSVDNSCPSSRVRGGRALRASFRGGSRAATVVFGQAPKLVARVIGRDGSALAGARICVLARTRMPGAEWRPLAMRRTRPDGRLIYPLAVGPSRELRLVYRDDSVQVERRLRLSVHTRPKLDVRPRRTRNGARVSFEGTIPGPGQAGRVIILQARARGGWRTFETARTGLRGRFTAGYRFRETTTPTVYRFRAVARRQAGYPYLYGRSRPVAVRVGG